MKKVFFGIAFALFMLLPSKSEASLLYTGAANQAVYVDETFVVEWYLDTQGRNINSMDLRLTYSSDKLAVVETSAAGSAFDLWIRNPQFDNAKGEIRLTGGVSSGINDKRVSIFRATFKPLQAGSAKISMAANSEILLADGFGTQDKLTFNEVNFTINPPEANAGMIRSPSHPDQNSWYQEQNVLINIIGKPGEVYSYSFSSNLEIFPDAKPDDITGPIRMENLPDGIYYFKLNSRAGSGNWQEAGVYRVQIDTTPPKAFKPALAQDPSVFDGQAFVSFNTSDSVSGILYYEVRSSRFGGWERVDETYYKLPGLVLGDKIEVKVVDAAGNERISSIEVDRSMVNSVFSNLLFWVIITLILLAVAWGIKHYVKQLRKYKVNDN